MVAFLRLVAVWLCLALGTGIANAQLGAIPYSGNSGTVPAAPLVTTQGASDFEKLIGHPSNAVPGGYDSDFERLVYGEGGGVKVEDRYKGKIGEKTVPIKAARTVTAAGAARAAARVLGGPGGLVAGVAAEAAYDAWCKRQPTSVVCHIEQPASAQTMWTGPNNSRHPSASAALDAHWAPFYAAGYTVGGCGVKTRTKGAISYPNSQRATQHLTIVDNCGYTHHFDVSTDQTTAVVCPAVPNFFDPRYTQPGGPANAAGKCPSAVSAPAAEEELTTKLQARLTPAQLPAVVREAIGRGVDVGPLASPQTISGPSSVSQTPVSTTTTSPGGSPQTTTTTTNNNITYGGSSFSWTTINNYSYSDGSTKTEEKPPPDDKSECEKNPQAVGCQKLDLPAGDAMPTSERLIVLAPDAGWGASDASCPPPRVVSVMGMQIPIDNTLVCQFLSGIRFAVIGVCALVAGLIFIGGVKVE